MKLIVKSTLIGLFYNRFQTLSSPGKSVPLQCLAQKLFLRKKVKGIFKHSKNNTKCFVARSHTYFDEQEHLPGFILVRL